MTAGRESRALQQITAGPSVLVVDDDASVRRLLGALLQGYGYRTMLVADGVEARAVVEVEDVALILCDAHLRRESGTTLVRDLLQQSPHSVALMMSGAHQSFRVHSGFDERVFGTIDKPFETEDLLERMALALRGRCSGVAPVQGAKPVSLEERHARLGVQGG